MPSVKIRKDLNSGWYFTTFTVHSWYYLFDRHNRWDILADSLSFCVQKNKLTLYAFVFMLNHMHLVFSSNDVAGFVRDFKKFTSNELRRNIVATEMNVLKLFENNGVYHFWQPSNMPLAIESERFLRQKIEYIHNNPVRKKYVERPEYWYWSSANTDCRLKVTSFV